MRLCAAPERKNKQRISHERGILFFVFSTMYGDTETEKRGGALVGTSTVTTVVESSAGIVAGGRTGMTSFVTAIAFLAAIIFAPVVSIVPAFCTIVFMPFTYSIANGIAMGLISYCLLKVLSRRRCEVEVLTMVIAVVFAFR